MLRKCIASSPRPKPHCQPSKVSWSHWTELLWIPHLSTRYIPWQESYTCNQANATEPTEARIFLGLVNTVARFIPNLTAMTEPTRRITHKNHPWLWGPEQSQAFNKLCDLISSDIVLAHFDPSLPTLVRHDACKIGITLNSAIAKLKEKPYSECGHLRGFIFTSMAVSLT